jgi:flavin reductase (DIM6/NTAB) family NADH-FMN oxidoreductase RutF
LLVTCADKAGNPNIISIALATPVSLDPPIIAICIKPARYSYELLKETGEFVVNIPSTSLAKHITFCGTVSGENADKFRETGLTAAPAKKVRTPIIKECIGHLECQVIQEIPVGDHSMFLGRVVAAYADEKIFDEEWLLDKARLVFLVGGRKTQSYTTPIGTFEAP